MSAPSSRALPLPGRLQGGLLHVLFFGLLMLLAGCASPPALAPSPQGLLRDDLFGAVGPVPAPQQVLAMTPAMVDYAEQEITALARSKGLRQGMLDALYKRGQLQLEYDDSRTRNAAEAFEARRGNCLSLVLMTAAFAKHLGLPVRFNSVFVEELWSRSGDLYLVAGHVNLSLGQPRLERSGARVFDVGELLTIDFLPADQLRRQRSRVIEEGTVLAMYYNNRSAESLREGQLDAAYGWARAAVLSDPRFLAAQNTLGVIYRRAGHPALAEQVFRQLLQQEPANTQTLSNLVLVLEERGQAVEAQQLSARLRELQPEPPYKFYDQGIEAMRRGEFQEAKRLFTRELERAAYVHEFHFWLALANYGLGQMDEVRKHLALAREHSTTPMDRERYAAKLESLRRGSRAAERLPG